MHNGPTTDPAPGSGLPTSGPDPAPVPPTGPLRLRAPAHRVHPRAMLWWTLRPLGFWVFPLVGEVLGLVFGAAPTWLVYLLIATIVLVVLHIGVMPQWRYRVHRWESSSDAVFTRAGWLNREWRVAPASRIQTVDTKRGPLEQLLGLATVTITTASAAGPIEINGLSDTDATQLVEELTRTTQATQGDAT